MIRLVVKTGRAFFYRGDEVIAVCTESDDITQTIAYFLRHHINVKY